MLEFLSCAIPAVNPGGPETEAAAAWAAAAAAAAASPLVGRYWDSEKSPGGTVPEESAAAYCFFGKGGKRTKIWSSEYKWPRFGGKNGFGKHEQVMCLRLTCSLTVSHNGDCYKMR